MSNEQTRQASNLGSNTVIKMTVKGNCGQTHTYGEWQKCELCKIEPIAKTDVCEYNEKGSIHIASWNAAIEAAAKMIDDMGEEARISEYIRELKK